MPFTAEQKSQLAKLLATENLSVQHQKISTAKFDTKNRVLYLPIWQNMTGIIYDLLVGHEVGHALYTPAEGWHDAVTEGDKNKNYKNFLNVVEDARIEKKIKRKYPGLNASFKQAYQELSNRDFFGVLGRNVNAMPFIDRLNLFSKSQWTTNWISFSAKEELLIKKVQAAESWEDVIRITDEIYTYSKDEQHEMKLQYYDEMLAKLKEESDNYNDDFDDYEFEESDESGESQDGDSEDGKEQKDSRQGNSNNFEGEEGEEDNKDSETINHDKLSAPGDKDQFNPECQTDENYRLNETQLLDEKCKEFVYLDIPKPILSNIITPAKRVQELMTKSYKRFIEEKWIKPDDGINLLNEFKRRNERYVSLLAKEFEMRKAAKSFSKSKLSDTGDIDVNKLASYKFDDNIFRKVMMLPKGKNHGLVLLLDCSGSMSRNMAGSIEQILILSLFCRKVNIPFTVYGFTEAQSVRLLDLGVDGCSPEAWSKARRELLKEDKRCFSQNIGEIMFNDVNMREYLNSKMSNAEFTAAMKNMCLLTEGYKYSGRYESSRIPRPESEQLNNTPMIQAIVATAEITKDFKRKNNLDLVSLVIVHDGDADRANLYWVKGEKRNNEGQPVKDKVTEWFDSNHVYHMRDRQSKFEYKLDLSANEMAKGILKWFGHATGSRVFGFFIVSSGRGNFKHAIGNRFFDEKGKTIWQIQNEIGYDAASNFTKNLMKQFRDEKFLVSKNGGYDNFFLIHGGEDLTTNDDDEIEVEGKFSARKLATAFAKYNKKRAVNRVLVSKFIQGIAA
jgi:hypothetical protein